MKNSERRLHEQLDTVAQNLRSEADARSVMKNEVTKQLDSNSLGDEVRKRIERETGEIRESFSERKTLGKLFSELGASLDPKVSK